MPAGYVGKSPVMPSGLTANQERAHRVMLKYQATQHRPVATRELARLLGLTSPQGAMCHLKALVLAGAVIELGKGARCYLAVPFDQKPAPPRPPGVGPSPSWAPTPAGGPARAKRGKTR